MQLYSNENFPLGVVEGLRKLGYDIITTKDVGKSGQRIPDEEVLQYAISQKRAVITINRKDFKRLHRLTPNHYGIIICTENLDFNSFVGQIDAALNTLGDISGQLIRVYCPNNS
jgi:predicted nuclease of predicted toxin-antitoxin system